jgi:hypothetical protein
MQQSRSESHPMQKQLPSAIKLLSPDAFDRGTNPDSMIELQSRGSFISLSDWPSHAL